MIISLIAICVAIFIGGAIFLGMLGLLFGLIGGGIGLVVGLILLLLKLAFKLAIPAIFLYGLYMIFCAVRDK